MQNNDGLEKFGYLLQGGNGGRARQQLPAEHVPVLERHPALRDWVATESLRRNGPDLSSGFGVPQLYVIMQRLSDENRINRLFAAERQRDPALSRWLDDRFVSRYRKNDLRDHPEGTLGRAYFAMLDAANLDVEILPGFEPRSDAQYFMLRAQQTPRYRAHSRRLAGQRNRRDGHDDVANRELLQGLRCGPGR